MDPLSIGLTRRLARFLHDFLSDLDAWLNSEASYNKQAIPPNLPGFQRIWAIRTAKDPIPEQNMLNHTQFKTISVKWHKKITDSFVACIESRDYMCIRNSILILTKIAKFFPYFKQNGWALEAVVTSLVQNEKREDLRVLAMGCVPFTAAIHFAEEAYNPSHSAILLFSRRDRLHGTISLDHSRYINIASYYMNTFVS